MSERPFGLEDQTDAERLAVIEAGARQSLIDCLDPNEGVWTSHHRTLAVSRADRYAAAKAANSRADLLTALKEDLAYLEKMLYRSHCEHWPYELRAAIDHTRKALHMCDVSTGAEAEGEA